MFGIYRRSLGSIRLRAFHFHRSFGTNRLFQLSKEVRDAKHAGCAIVALESTLITHGLPYPENLRVAKRLEEIVRSEGAVPATIALIGGRICVGLTSAQLESIANVAANKATKSSLRDICNVLANKTIGGTTVAATMWIANQAGVKVFATGGTGGVHRGAENSFDISADLTELGRVPVAVVCAGAKSILDIAKTLEVLETNSVNVVALSEDDSFPGFFTPKTPYRAPFHTTSLETVADVLVHGTELNMQAGTLIACPVPSEYATDAEFVEKCVEQAVSEATHMSSKDVTPFILRRVNELSGSQSMKINIALLENNARIAAKLAKLYAERINHTPGRPIVAASNNNSESEKKKRPSVLCVGASILDIEALSLVDNPKNHGAYYPAELHMRAGGVARNHAEALAKLNCDVNLLSPVGDDLSAQILQSKSPKLDFSNVLKLVGQRTATSVGINVLGEIQNGFIDVDEIMEHFSPKMIEDREHLFAESDFVVIDANLTVETLDAVLSVAVRNGKPVWLDPTNYLKIPRIFERKVTWPMLGAISPNAMEFRILCDYLQVPITEKWMVNPTALTEFLCQSSNPLLNRLFDGNMNLIIVTLDTSGGLIMRKSPANGKISFHQAPPPMVKPEDVLSVSGAGDCFNCGYLAGHLHGLDEEKCIEVAVHCATKSLRSTVTAPDSLTEIAQEYLN